jgi:hypothetical protein
MTAGGQTRSIKHHGTGQLHPYWTIVVQIDHHVGAWQQIAGLAFKVSYFPSLRGDLDDVGAPMTP